MKKRIFIMTTLILLYFQFGRKPTVNSTTTFTSNNEYVQSLSITANQIYIFDKQHLSEQLIQKCIDNDFSNFMFSYDIGGYPTGLEITVYTNSLCKYFRIEAFSAKYTSYPYTVYNIKDNPEKYSLELR